MRYWKAWLASFVTALLLSPPLCGYSAQLPSRIVFVKTVPLSKHQMLEYPARYRRQKTHRAVFALDPNTGRVTSLCNLAGELMLPKLSPDGQTLLVSHYLIGVSSDWEVYLYDVRRKTKLLQMASGAQAIDWMGKRRYIGVRNDQILETDLDDGVQRKLFKVDSYPVNCSVAGGGKLYFDFTNRNRQPKSRDQDEDGVSEIRVFDLATKTTKYLFDGCNVSASPDGRYLVYSTDKGLYLYDLSSKTRKLVDSQVFLGVFSPDSHYLAYPSPKRSLVITDLDLRRVKAYPLGDASDIDW